MSDSREHGTTRALLAALEQAADRIEALERASHEPIAVIGLSCRFPGGAGDPAAFWELLRTGTDAIAEVPPDRWDLGAYYDPDPDAAGKMYARHGGFIGGVDRFDPQFFEIAPREAAALDPQHRLLLELTWQAFEHANLPRERVAGTESGVFVGITNHDYERVLNRLGESRLDAYSSQGNTLNAAAGRLAYVFGLRGPAIAVDTACSSSLVAVHLACQSLRRGECAMAVAAGVNLILSPEGHIALSRMKALAPDGRCKTFDAAADGYVRGEGGGVVILKRLSDARAAGDVPLAVIRGSAVNQDGASGGFTVPSGRAQQAVIRQALADAQLTPADIAYVEAHGTGTSLGDPIETGALAAVFGGAKTHTDPLLIGSLKTNVGHLESAAGIASLIKVVLALGHGEIPPHLHFHQPSPHIAWDHAPLRVVEALSAWPEGTRRAGLSAFGASGTNAHLIVEEAPVLPAAESSERPVHPVVLSARSEAALAEQARNLCAFLETTHADLADVAYAASAGRSHFPHRLAAVAATREDAAAALRAFLDGDRQHVTRGRAGAAVPPKLAFLCTGHGSQSAGMAGELFRTSGVFRRVVQECDEELAQLGVPFVAEVFGGGDRWLARNDVAHPALFAIEIALAELYASWGVKPDAVMGYSLGEYAAACIAGVFSVRDGLRLVAARAALMQALPGDGTMAAVFADEAAVRQALPADGQVVIAARNGPGHTVISGPRADVDEAVATLARGGIECVSLAVTHAFHSPLMEPMRDAFLEVAASVPFQPPRVPVVSNVTGDAIGDAIATPAYWCDHALRPVEFSRGLDALLQSGCEAFLELGPHPVLSGLARETHGDAALWVPSLDRRVGNWQSLVESLASLHVHGVAIDWAGVDGRTTRARVVLPSYPFERRRVWMDGSAPRATVAGERDVALAAAGLAGRRLTLPDSADMRFEYIVRADAPAFLQDHRVRGQVVFPGAAYVAMALDASTALLGRTAVTLEDVTFERPLMLPPDEDVTLQLVIARAPNTGGAEGPPLRTTSSSFTIHARNGDGWTRHASGRIAADEPGAPEAVPASSARRDEMTGDAYYEECGRRGLEFGPLFRGLESAWRLDADSAEASIRLPEACEPDRLAMHPVILDAAFQALGPVVSARGANAAYLPFSIGRLHLYRRPGARLSARARVTGLIEPSTPEIGAAVTLWDDRGVVAQVEQFSLRRAPIAGTDPLYEVAWIERPRPVTEGAAAVAPCVIVADRGGVGRELARQLTSAGIEASLVDSDAWRQAASDRPVGHVLLLHGLDTADVSGEPPAALEAELRRLCERTLDAIRDAADMPRPPRLWIVTRGAQAADGRMDAAGCPQAVLWGIARTAAMEHDELRPVRVDLDGAATDQHAAARICDELRAGGPDDEVALRGERRFVSRLARWSGGDQEASREEGERIRADRSYLITGGAGGLGLVTAAWLIERGARNLVLVARSAPDGDAAERLDAWRREGLEVFAHQADVSVPNSLAEALDRARRLAPLGGVFHSAGTLADGTLAQHDWDTFRRVFPAKVHGAWNLHRLTREDALDHFVIYSSTAGVLGSPGQANHGAANAFVDALAWHRRTLGLPAIAIDWGAWSRVGTAARHGVEEKAQSKGVGAIDPDTGMRILARLLDNPVTQIAVAPVDWPTFARQFPAGRVPGMLGDVARGSARTGGRTEPAADEIRARLAAAPADRRAAIVAAHVLTQLSAVLDIPADRIDPAQPLTALGLDSLMALELRKRFKATLDVDVPVRSLLGGPSTTDLAAQLAEDIERSAPVAAPGAAVSADETRIPLTPGQQALWILHRTAPESAAYNTAIAARIRSALDVPSLERACAALVRRHEALRTTFDLGGGSPAQRVRADLDVPLESHDSAGLTDADVRQAVSAAYARPFDLATGPLARVDLFTRAPDDHILLLTLHHIVGDAWSLWILIDELLQLYRAEASGSAAALAPATPYSAFVRWQAERLASPDAEASWAYWRALLEGPLPTLDLPADRPRPPVPSYEGASFDFAVPGDLTARLREAARQEGVTLYVLLLACLNVLLRRVSGQDDVVLGTLTSGRTNPAFTETVGYFVNPVVIRTAVDPRQPFAALLARVRDQALAALEHQDFPFPTLVERLQPKRDPSRSPIFQVLFVLQKPQSGHTPAAIRDARGGAGALRLEPYPFPQMEGQFDLTLEITDADALGGVLRYSTDLFDRETISRLSALLVETLRAVCDDRQAPIEALAPLPAEDARLLARWNDTSAEFPSETCMHTLIEQQVARTPDAVAVVFEGQRWTYRQVNERADALAAQLRALGAGPEVLVGLSMERSLELVVSILAVLKAGAAYVPLDPDYPRERLEFMLQDSNVAIVLSGKEPPRVNRAPAPPARPLEPGPDNLAYMIYTSGSTGRPKGAMNTHCGLVNRITWMQAAYGLDGTDAVLQKTPFSFDVSVWEFVWPLMTGARLVVCRPGGHQDPRYLAELMREEQVTTLHFVPSMLRAFLDQPDPGTFPSLRRVICSGEALPPELARQALTTLGSEVHNLYGPTEAAIDVTAWPCSLEDEATVPIGRPIFNTQIHVVDGAWNACPVGVPGELCIAGVNVGRGYHARPDLTADRFVPNPFGPPGSRMYRTGDLARWQPGGEVVYLGRLDTQVKIRGFRIELGEIEARLGEHPSIREAAVIARTEADGSARLVAYAVALEAPPSTTELHRFIRQTLPDYMVPSAFVWLPALPLSPNGKLDRQALPEPPTGRPRLESEFEAPASETEQRIAEAWRAVLPVDRIGVHDNFFELGGQSLLLAQVHARLQQTVAPSLTMIDLFRHPTIQLLARHLERIETAQPDARDTTQAEQRTSRAAQLGDRRKSRLDHRRGGVPQS